MRLPLLCTLGLVTLLAGCATLSQEECLSGNWQEIGQRDGQNGRTADHLSRHAKACEKVGVLPDRAAWERGRQAGLTLYCTPARAYEEGRTGRRLSPVCPASGLAALQAANDRGLQYHGIGLEISGLQSETREVELALAAEKEADRRRALVLRLRNLNDRIALLRLRQQTYARV